jgi:LysM repeat protein
VVVVLLALALLMVAGPSVRGQEDPDARTHVVRRGESLSSIAQHYHTTVRALREWNDLRGSRILIGQELRVPTSGREYVIVRRGDTLGKIAQRYGVPVDLLRQVNGTRRDRIYVGQKLKLQPSHHDEVAHLVERGETLTEIARMHSTTVAALREVNGLDSDRIYPGQHLRLREVAQEIHVVEPGDALWEIARAYGMSLRQLKDLNGLRGNRIYPGQELRVRAKGQAHQREATYVVRRGDTLGEIAQLHQMSLSELRHRNSLRSNIIHPGQKLKVRPLLGGRGTAQMAILKEVPWDDLVPSIDAVPAISLENGPYFFSHPHAREQSSNRYLEAPTHLPAANYARASKLWSAFEKKVESLGYLGHELDGWHVVLDPGHGGIDPGAIVKSVDGNGNPTYVVEDEYVYDVALRAYVLLKLHGAEVDLTLLSPNHLIRGNEPATATFVHEQNEVFHSRAINRRNRSSSWPRGGHTGLRRRRELAAHFFASTPKGRRVFVSLHADNAPEAPEAKSVLYYQDSRRVDQASRRFARALLPALGAGSRARGQNLGVLRGNVADVAVLIEVRNLSYRYEAWALRFEQLRQRDAEKIVQGLLDWVAVRSG